MICTVPELQCEYDQECYTHTLSMALSGRDKEQYKPHDIEKNKK